MRLKWWLRRKGNEERALYFAGRVAGGVMSCTSWQQASMRGGNGADSVPLNYAQVEEQMIGIKLDGLAVKIQSLAL